MSVFDFARVMIYRFHETGLEIFLINNEMDKDPDVWKLPEGIGSEFKNRMETLGKEAIDLDEISTPQGEMLRTLAIEGDWHDIPSIRGMLKHDMKIAKKIIKEKLPGSEKGAFVAAKECFKKVLPHEYQAIKELKDILTDRNTVKNM
jgi:hypothetical protein